MPPLSRLCLCAPVALLAAAPVAVDAGESRAVLAVTARVVHACSISTPSPATAAQGGGELNTGVDHRCTAEAVPHRVSVRPLDAATDSAVADAGAGPVVEQRREGPAGGEILMVTVTY